MILEPYEAYSKKISNLLDLLYHSLLSDYC